MKNKLLLKLPLLCSIISVLGCVSKENNPPPIQTYSLNASFENAKNAERNRQYINALGLYKEIENKAKTTDIRCQAKLGSARCLVALKKLPAALNALKPFQENPKSDSERKTLGFAGEILLRINKPKEAEILLETVANSMNLDSDIKHWSAPVLANLGRAQFENYKYKKAVKSLKLAVIHFRKLNKNISAKRVENLKNKIQKLIPIKN